MNREADSVKVYTNPVLLAATDGKNLSSALNNPATGKARIQT
jgi:hypothetical protein